LPEQGPAVARAANDRVDLDLESAHIHPERVRGDDQ
jgi:hypothetical protein